MSNEKEETKLVLPERYEGEYSVRKLYQEEKLNELSRKTLTNFQVKAMYDEKHSKWPRNKWIRRAGERLSGELTYQDRESGTVQKKKYKAQ